MSDPQPVPLSPPPPGDGPLGDLALAFSGGGYRAAAFHLGALRLLERTGLLRDVVALSTVSGGSIVGARWVLSVMRGEPFRDFERGFAQYLRTTNVIREALDHLAEHREHGHPSQPSLIRSAARVYARDDLFGDTRLSAIQVPAAAAGGEVGAAEGERTMPRFREVILNSTEFRTGVDFRFRRSANPHVRFGNGKLVVPAEVAQRVRVADAVAASSCFPGGFEPLVFPQQFAWTDDLPLPAVEAALGEKFGGGVALMDGGIYDNQGVDSLVLAFRNDEAPPTMLVSDVAARNDDIYNVPAAGRRGWLTLRMAAVGGWILFFASLVSAVLLASAGWSEWSEGERGGAFFFRYGLPFAFCAGMAGVLFWMRMVLREVQARLKDEVQISDAWHDLAKLTVREALAMVHLRVGSLLALTSTVFMKRIRTLIFSGVAATPKYRGRLMANYVYSLDLNRPSLYGRYPWLEPSAELRGLARCAERYPTTLWFDRPDDAEMIIRAGEVTTCFIVLEYIAENRQAQLADPASPVAKLFARLRQEWDVYNGAAAARGWAVPPACVDVAAG